MPGGTGRKSGLELVVLCNDLLAAIVAAGRDMMTAVDFPGRAVDGKR